MKVCIVYHFFAHYRGPIIQELIKCRKNHFYFLGGEQVSSSYSKLKLFDFGSSERYLKVNNYWFFKHFLWQSGLIKELCSGKFDVVIFLGDWKFMSTWFSLIILKFKKVPTLFWSHGIRTIRPSVNSKLKILFLKQFSHGGFVYDYAAKDVMESSGFIKPISVIFNSLNYNYQNSILELIKRKTFKSPIRPYVVFSGRLESRKNLDELIKAISHLRSKNVLIDAVIIGDGSDKPKLLELAKKLGVINNVNFVGSCYDEKLLCRYFYQSIACVIPASVGLTAIHALTYGSPIITNDNFESHGPEIASVVDGVSGFYYKDNDFRSLATLIQKLSEVSSTDREILRLQCMSIIRDNFTPENQISVINNHLAFLYRGRKY